ncbi:hypothetical protein HGRIS_008208 [Hohenbuehelia grisea]|uniref:Glycogenin n=1 Tax=Hohenbuehelia grisea TaxID=104357 RepID=A0ABR3J7B0_9AGAR
MAHNYAFVTLLTSDAYLPGALALAAALKDVHPSPVVTPEVDFDIVCLVTPETVDVSSIKLLRRAFNVVIGVEVIGQQDEKGLQLLGRPDLDTVLTKLHVFRLTQYSKIIFLDADVLPIRPLSHLFTLPYEFSAAPDVGWPDIFNSGVLVLSPGEDNFTELNQLLKSKGTWDGGDQGILNEWRGVDWNRLSFTYNTTPTAAYTYAPAYERYGSKISAIHFIGPNKPWKSIAYRAPFAGSQPTDSAASDTQRAYDYNSLVDRWYAVYDRHYRNETFGPEAEFEVRHYASAWDDTPTGAEMVASTEVAAAGAFGLDELRKLAIEGVVPASTGTHVQNRDGEGEYRSMPLEGRVHLLRPRPIEESRSQERTPVPRELPLPEPGSAPLMATLPTPGPDEYPPSPHLAPRSLPGTVTSSRQASMHEDSQHKDPPNDASSSRYPSYLSHGSQDHEHHHQGGEHDHQQHQQQWHQPPSQDSQPQHEHRVDPHVEHHDHGHHHHPAPQQHHDHGYHHHHEHHQEKPRPPSPPMLIWNPAVDPPPNNPPKADAFPTDTYFTNVWDHTPSKHNDQAYHAPETPRDSGGFFQPPPNAEIPEHLLQQGHYRNVLGDQGPSHVPPVPDVKKVKSVFPWEEKPRHMPGRVFPSGDAPLPSQFVQPEAPRPPSPPAPPEPPAPTSPEPYPARPSPIYGFPPNLAFANAWDTVPSIQKYASKLVRPPPVPHSASVSFEAVRRKRGESFRSWDERLEQSSRDGDDEDEGDEEGDTHEPIAGKWDEDSEQEESPKTSPKTRSRAGSISAGYLIKGKRKDYRTRGVQTMPREMRSQAVQVEMETPKVLTARLPERKTSRQGSSSGKKSWAPSGVSAVLQPLAMHDMSVGPEAVATPTFAASPTTQPLSPDALNAVNLPSGIRSPREFNFPTSPPPGRTTPRGAQTPITKPRSPPSPAQAITISKAPSDSSSATSAPSSAGPVSPPETLHAALPVPPPRKAGRVWDPARGVELFKRGSEEVLARFLRMGWEDEARRSPEV